MRNIRAIANRELLSLFCSPMGYIVIAFFLALTGVFVIATRSLEPGQPATLRSVFGFMPIMLTIFAPAITMRMLSDEYRTGTIETLMTVPVSDLQVVLGKYFAAFLYYCVMVAGTLIYVLLMLIFGSPDLGSMFTSYIGLLLAGAMFLSVGLFASSLTPNQIVAWVTATIPMILFVFATNWVVSEVDSAPAIREVLQRVNIWKHMELFNRGLLMTESVAFFLATTMLFVFLTIKTVESRRWR
ncbi:MAG: ABC transporter permease subunit [Phycisphaerales bacterium]|nr:ABC transporter permease subunit [Phycisphaerales bacterium]